MDHLDLARYRAADTEAIPAAPTKPPVPRNGELLLKGPVPADWLSVVARMPGKTSHVALAIWCEAGIQRQRRVKLTRKFLNLFGVNRYATYRALELIESNGLATIERRRGRSPFVTIKEVDR